MVSCQGCSLASKDLLPGLLEMSTISSVTIYGLIFFLRHSKILSLYENCRARLRCFRSMMGKMRTSLGSHMSKLRNLLIGAGIAAVGAIGTKTAVDYLRNRGEDDAADEKEGDKEASSPDEVSYVKVEPSSVQEFLDKSFGDPGRYVPNRSPKIFELQGKQYMVIWARDNQQDKNQMMAFAYTDSGREMIASVGYTAEKTDYNLELASTPFAVEVNGKKMTSGQGETDGANDVDLVLA